QRTQIFSSIQQRLLSFRAQPTPYLRKVINNQIELATDCNNKLLGDETQEEQKEVWDYLQFVSEEISPVEEVTQSQERNVSDHDVSRASSSSSSETSRPTKRLKICPLFLPTIHWTIPDIELLSPI